MGTPTDRGGTRTAEIPPLVTGVRRSARAPGYASSRCAAALPVCTRHKAA